MIFSIWSKGTEPMALGCRRALMCGAAMLLLPASAFGQTTHSGTFDPVPPASGQQSRSTAAVATDEPAAQISTSSDNGASSGDATSRTDISGQISDIVVTAQRRSENLQRVPISAEVVGAPALAQKNLTSLNDIGSVNPSIRVSNGLRSNAIYVRGTGSGDSQSFDQSVGTFIDDIYHGRSRGSAATFLDLDHVEILKGPQTTYFGNNAIAGAFNIVTEKPGKDLDGWARALISPDTGTNGGQYALEGGVTIPLSDTFGVRVAGTYNGQEGWLYDTNFRDNRPKVSALAARATARWTPTDRLDIILKGEIGRTRNEGGLYLQTTSCPPPPPFVASGFCALDLAAGNPTGLKNNSFSSNGSYTSLSTQEAVLTASYDLGGSTLTSVTGVNSYHTAFDLDPDGTPLDLVTTRAPERYRQFSQELRLASQSGRRFEYIAGLYFQSDTLRTLQQINYFVLTPLLTGSPFASYAPLSQQINARIGEKVYSAFGAFTWNATDKLKLTGTLRGSIVDKDFNWALFYGTATQEYGGTSPLPTALQGPAGLLGLGNAGTLALNRSDRALMPGARVQYQIAPDTMAYASFTRGFKAGGFSVGAVSAVPSDYGFNPEHVNAYEAGLKSELFNRTLLVDLAVFRNNFSDLQVSVQGQNASGGFVNFVRNAAQSRSQGVEIEGQWIISPAFKLVGSGSYLDSKYLSYDNAGPTAAQRLAGQSVQSLAGKRTPFAPEWSGTVSAIATAHTAGGYRLSGEATGIFSSSYQTFSTLDPLTLQPGYARLDARISFDSPDGRWGLDIIGKNLTSAVIRTFSAEQPFSLGSLLQQKEQPINVAFQARIKF